jgi:hypothetical protein
MEENIKRLRERINALELALANPKVTIDKRYANYTLERGKKLLKEIELEINEKIKNLN